MRAAAPPAAATKPLHVAHCIHGVGLGGAQQIVKYIVGGSDPEAFRYWVYCSQGGIRQRQIEDAGATVRVLPRRLPKLDPWWISALAQAMETDRIDVVHTHLFGDTLHGYLAARRLGLPVVMTLHNVASSRTWLQRAGYRWLLARADVPVACADFVRRSFRQLAGDGFARLRTVANGIVTPPRQPRATSRALLADRVGARTTATLLASIGRMHPQKGYGDLLDAVARLPGELDVQLILFGDGASRPDLEAQARRLGLGDRVLFAGLRDDLPELLWGIDVVVFSSLWEGLPVALLEAMAAARCLVVTAVGGIPEAVTDEVEALMLAPHNSPALAAALARVITDGELRDRLGSAASRRFHEHFAVAGMVTSYEAIYRQALAASRSER